MKPKELDIDRLLTHNLHINGYILGFYDMYLKGGINLEEFVNLYEKVIDTMNDY